MKLHTEKREVERSGNQESVGFTIKATAQSFEILSSTLYSDKIKAIVRELSCNAYDSHVAAGCADRPIEICLPTMFDSKFYVKDYGLGLSHEDVMKLYTTYFESTKTGSDDFIGQLGLGSKSPFSYASTFNVESRWMGEKRIYVCNKNEEGFPEINLMHVEDTQEPNGLTISLACKTNDVEKFRNAAKKALMYFNPMPNFVSADGGSIYTFQPYALKHTVDGGIWKLRDTEYGSGQSGAYVVQGFVAYPIDAEQLGEAGLSGTAYELCSMDIDLFVPIGEVSPMASREHLHYNNYTIQNLVRYFNKIAQEARDVLQQQIDACETPYAAALLYEKLYAGQTDGGAKLARLFKRLNEDTPFTWRGDLFTSTVKFDVTGVKSFKIQKIVVKQARRRSHTLDVTSTWAPFLDGVAQQVEIEKSMALTINSGTLFVVNDTKRTYHRTSMKEYLAGRRATNDKSHVFLIEAINPRNGVAESEIEAFKSQHPDIPMIALSSIPMSANAARRTATGSYAKRQMHERYCWAGFTTKTDHYGREKVHRKFNRGCWKLEEVDLDKGGVYVPFDTFRVFGHDGFDVLNLDKLITAAKALGILEEDVQIVGFNLTDQTKYLPKNKKWKSLVPYLRKEFLKLNADNSLTACLCGRHIIDGLDKQMYLWLTQEWLAGNPPAVADGPFREAFVEIGDIIKDATDVERAKVIEDFIDIAGGVSTVKDTQLAQKVVAKWKEAKEQYEMLTMIDWSNQYTVLNRTAVVNYVNMVDALRVEVTEEPEEAAPNE